MAGEAGLRFDKESELAYCPVKPLLRLPEARRLWGAVETDDE
jgi:hypothetical protein